MRNTDTAEKIVSCMICGTRWATVVESTGHTCTDPAADITPAEAAIFATLLAAEDVTTRTRAALAFAPANLPDRAWTAMKINHRAARFAAVKAFNAGFAQLGNRMAQFGAYRTLAAYAQAITQASDI